MINNKFYNFIFSKLNGFRYFIYEKYLYEKNKKKLNSLIKKKTPLISVILPTFNRSDMLKLRSIPSVLNQTYNNFELLIISDGSTDDTKKVVSEFKDERIKFFEIKRDKIRYPQTAKNHWYCGPVMAINHGLNQMKGDWICRIDDDDIWTNDHIEILLQFAKKNNLEFVSSSRIEDRYGYEEILHHREWNPRIGGVASWLYAGYFKFVKSNINCWRKSWNKVNDTDVWERLNKLNIRHGFIEVPTVKILPRPGEKTLGLKVYERSESEYKKKYDI